jgi:hypothetical protein
MGATQSNHASVATGAAAGSTSQTPAPSGDAASMQQESPVSDSDVPCPSALPSHGDGYVCYICHTVFVLKQQLFKHITCALVFGYPDHLVLRNRPVAPSTPDWLIPLITNLHEIDHETAGAVQREPSLFGTGRPAQQELEESITWSPQDAKNGLVSPHPKLHGSTTVIRSKTAHVTSQAQKPVNSNLRKRHRGPGGSSQAPATSGDDEHADYDTNEYVDDGPHFFENSNATCQVCLIHPFPS